MRIIKIEIDNDIYQKIFIEHNGLGIFIHIYHKDIKQNQVQTITIDRKTIHSFITSLRIMYKDITNKDYPNK